MSWGRDSRYTAGGFWRCRVVKNERLRVYYDQRREAICKQRRDRYDNDPVHRIEKLMHDGKRNRRQSIERRRQAHGALPE